MNKTLKTLTLSAMIALGAAGGLTATTSGAFAAAAAAGPGAGHGPGHGTNGGTVYHDGCRSDYVIDQVRLMGLHRVQIRYYNNDVVAVSGRSHGHRATFLFTNDGFCKLIR